MWHRRLIFVLVAGIVFLFDIANALISFQPKTCNLYAAWRSTPLHPQQLRIIKGNTRMPKASASSSISSSSTVVAENPQKSNSSPILIPSFMELVRFTIFAMPIYISPSLLSLIDTAVVGQVSSVDLAAMGPACAICDGISNLMVFISVGTTNSVSTAVGESDSAAAKRAASVSVVVSFFIGCAVATALYTAVGPLTARAARSGTFGASAVTASRLRLWNSCASYVRIRALSFPAALVLLSAQASCLGSKDSKSPTIATLLASMVNIVGDYLLVLGPFRLGIEGAAWATVGCQVVAALALLRTLHRKGLVDGSSLFSRMPRREEIRRFFAFGAFIFVLAAKTLVYNQAVALATILGPAQGAAHQVLYSLSRFCYTLGDVTGATAQAFLPQFYKKQVNSKGDEYILFDAVAARPTIKKIIAMTAVVAAVATTICLCVPILLPGVFTKDDQVINLMRHAAPFAAFGLSMHPSVVGMEGCLLATRDIRWLVTNYATTGVLSLLATQLLLQVEQLRRILDLRTIWIYLACYQGIRFTSFLWRLLLSTRTEKVPPESGPESLLQIRTIEKG